MADVYDCSYDYSESVSDYSSEKFVNYFQDNYQEELQAEFEDIGYVTHSKDESDTFTEAVDRLVTALSIKKPKEIAILLNTALVGRGINKADASLSHMYQIWYQDCNKVFVNKYGSNTPPEPSPMTGLAA